VKFTGLFHPWVDFGIYMFGLFGVNYRGLFFVGAMDIFIWGFVFFILHDIGHPSLNNPRNLGGMVVLFGWLCSGGFLGNFGFKLLS
jgi:hypothetical protein